MVAAVLHVGAILLIIILVLSLSPRLNSGVFVFSTLSATDDTNVMSYEGQPYIGAIGLLFACFCFTGYDACGHMA
jgi:amino acid transporter